MGISEVRTSVSTPQILVRSGREPEELAEPRRDAGTTTASANVAVQRIQ
jgi:hypothetical protein